MAISSFELLADRPIGGFLRGALLRLAGAACLCAGLFAALALWGFDPADPSWSQATAAPVANPAGAGGAILADLLLQATGLGAWILCLVLVAWGIRLLGGGVLPRPWLPIAALPLALLAASAAFATIAPLPTKELWPYRVGLGGFVGDFLFGAFGTAGSRASFALWAGIPALLFATLALGLRWAEALVAFGRLGRVSSLAGRVMGKGAVQVGRRMRSAAGVAGREMGGAAGRAGRGLGLAAGRMAEAGAGQWSRYRRPAPAGTEEEPEAEPAGWRQILARRAAASADPAEDPLENETVDEAPPRRLRRSGLAAARDGAPAVAEAPEPVAPVARPRRAAPPPPETEGGYELPGLDLLAPPAPGRRAGLDKQALEEMARQLESVLDDFGVKGEIIDVKPGPVVTLFELEPAPGTRSQRVIGLADDIARSLCALSVRVATVPGRNVIGIELPNERRETVYLRDILEDDGFARSEARLPLALGKDIAGKPVTVDLSRMPHLLIAGTTGSGKSVAINAMILSLLYRLTPEQCRIIMIDPKVIELSIYEDIPHLLSPVVTEPHKAVVALKWVVRQMDERYRLMSHVGVRDIFAFNKRIEQAAARGEELKRRVRTGFDPATGAPIIEEQPIPMEALPLIVVVVDEVADLMLTAGKEIETAVQRLSQKARAAGIHLIVATQRPSVDVITGVIKANLPSRISFRVSSKIDSRTVLGDGGAEQLLGQGDMLYLMPGDRIIRVHGPLVTDGEVEAVVRHLREQGHPDYVDEVTSESGAEAAEPGGAGQSDLFGEPAGGDQTYRQAVQIVARDGKASTSYLQRKLSIGYNSAAKLIERMEQEGLISTADHVGRRQVLMGRGGVDGDELTDIED